MSHLLHLHVLEELSPRQRKVRCELLDASLLGDLDLVALEWLLLTLAGLLIVLESLLVVGAQVGDQGGEVVQSAFGLREYEFFLVQLHRRVDNRDLFEEVRDLLLLPLELAVLLI